MRSLRSFIPNALTCGNLLSGCVGIILVSQGNLEAAFWCALLAGVCDFFDGFAARLLNVQGPLGRELDSLADCITFGVMPGMVLFSLSASSLQLSFQQASAQLNLAWLAMLVPVASAYRLAKFNIDTRQSEQFIGLPTPANGLFLCSLPLLVAGQHSNIMAQLLQNTAFLAGITVLFSWLLISPLPLIALKFKNYGLAGNSYRYALVVSGLLLPTLFGFAGVPLVILSYLLLSATEAISTLNRKNS